MQPLQLSLFPTPGKKLDKENSLTDTEANFNPKDYENFQNFLDDSINQFMYEEEELDCMAATFFEEKE